MLCWGKVKLTGLLRRLTSSGDIFANEVVRFESLSMQEAPYWITSHSATLVCSTFQRGKDFRGSRRGPAAHAGVFRHLSLHRGRRCAAARMAYCLQGQFGKLCGRKPQYAVSLLRGTTSSLMAFENQRSVSDALFGFRPKPCSTADRYIPRRTYFCLFTWQKRIPNLQTF